MHAGPWISATLRIFNVRCRTGDSGILSIIPEKQKENRIGQRGCGPRLSDSRQSFRDMKFRE
jgi:hypothetical protein